MAGDKIIHTIRIRLIISLLLRITAGVSSGGARLRPQRQLDAIVMLRLSS